MSRLQRLLQEMCWGIQHNREGINLEEQRCYELETGIFKFCNGLELFQHAWRNDKLDFLRKELFENVKNMPEETNLVSQIKTLESEIDSAIICLENIKINSDNLKLLHSYLKSVRGGDFLLPEAYKPKQ